MLWLETKLSKTKIPVLTNREPLQPRRGRLNVKSQIDTAYDLSAAHIVFWGRSSSKAFLSIWKQISKTFHCQDICIFKDAIFINQKSWFLIYQLMPQVNKCLSNHVNQKQKQPHCAFIWQKRCLLTGSFEPKWNFEMHHVLNY